MTEDPSFATHGASPAADQTTPADLKLKRVEQELRITWKDGCTSVYSAATLRKNCPCATCRAEREKQSATALTILKQSPEDLELVNAQLVGHYAIQLFWSDGHNTGIFDFRYVRSLDEADG